MRLKTKRSPFSWGRQGLPGRRKSQEEAMCGPVNRSPSWLCRGWEGERWASAEPNVQRGALRARVQDSDMMEAAFQPARPRGGWVTTAPVTESFSPRLPQESPHRPQHRPGPHHPGHRWAGHPLGYGREIHPQASGHRAAGESVRGRGRC